jgi:hypothetical protein
MRVGSADLRIDLVVITDVVAVRSRRGCEVGDV